MNVANENLKQLLSEYEKKRENAIRLAELQKENLYGKIPRLAEIDQEISLLTIQTSKALLQQKDAPFLDEFQRKLEKLRAEKEKIFQKNKIEYNSTNPVGYGDSPFFTV